MESPEQPAASVRPRRRSVRDWLGLVLQVALSVIGLHMMLAVGFRVCWHEDVVLQLRHPVYGLALILVGFAGRWLLSRGFRGQCSRAAGIDRRLVQDYSAGSATVPWRAAFCWVFLPTLVIYQSNDRTIGTADSVPAVQMALSLVEDGDLALDEFVDPQKPLYCVRKIGDHYYSIFSLGPAVVATPFVQVARWFGADLDDHHMRRRLEKVIASIVAAASAMFMFLVLLRLARVGPAVVLTVFYALASQNWIVSSQALWQHGPVALCVGAVLFVEYHCRHRPGWWASALEGALLGFAVACRPTAGILALVFCLLVLSRGVRHSAAFIGAAALAYLPFMLVHLSVYHSPLGPYQHAGGAGAWEAHYGDSLPGNLISPARGLLIYQPLMGLAALAILPGFGRRIGRQMRAALALWCILHLLAVSRYTHWWAGHCWGPRFLTELMPALTVLMAPAAVWLWHRRPGRCLVVGLMCWSIFLQATGAYCRHANDWMKDPVDIDQRPERLWDWTDPPFLYPWRSHPETPPSL